MELQLYHCQSHRRNREWARIKCIFGTKEQSTVDLTSAPIPTHRHLVMIQLMLTSRVWWQNNSALDLDCKFGVVPLKVMAEVNWTANFVKRNPLLSAFKAYSAWVSVGILTENTKYDGNLIRDVFLDDSHWICLYYLTTDHQL